MPTVKRARAKVFWTGRSQAVRLPKEFRFTTAEVTGKMSLHGLTRTITAPVKITYLKDKLKDRTGKEGDLLVIRSTFTIKRRDFGINPGQMEEKVSDEIELILSIAGAAQR